VGGSSIGMSLVKSKEDLAPAIKKALEQDRSVLIETYLQGTELTCAVIGNDQLEAYPVVEIIPGKNHEFFDYEAKYTVGASREICPANIEASVAEKVKAMAITAHTTLYCRGYSRTDLILCRRELYVIETNTIPGMTRTSLLPLSAEAAGIGFSSLLDRLIYLGIEEYTKKSQIRDHRRLQRILLAMQALAK
jgi:D-alanine-D-alanine ligase